MVIEALSYLVRNVVEEFFLVVCKVRGRGGEGNISVSFVVCRGFSGLL